MTHANERELARLRARFQHVATQLGDVGFLLRGSLVQRRRRCSSPGCGCQSDPERLHGPYWQWSSRIDGKIVTRNLSEEQVARYREWMENAKCTDAIVQELYDLSTQANEILRAMERASREPGVPAGG